MGEGDRERPGFALRKYVVTSVDGDAVIVEATTSLPTGERVGPLALRFSKTTTPTVESYVRESGLVNVRFAADWHDCSGRRFECRRCRSLR